MSLSPRNFNDALAYAVRESRNPSQDWTGYCQKFVRSCYGIPALYQSAYKQWQALESDEKHVGGNPADAPVGAALFFKGSGPFGHVDFAARDFKSGQPAAWSNDLVVYGEIDKVLRTAPTTAWGQRFLGWSAEINEVDLRIKEAKPPKPKQNKRYRAIEVAINKMERGLERAIKDKDQADASEFRREIRHLKKMYRRLRHA